jgi:hypothetical protein
MRLVDIVYSSLIDFGSYYVPALIVQLMMNNSSYFDPVFCYCEPDRNFHGQYHSYGWHNAAGGTRTLTVCILSALPATIGLQPLLSLFFVCFFDWFNLGTEVFYCHSNIMKRSVTIFTNGR